MAQRIKHSLVSRILTQVVAVVLAVGVVTLVVNFLLASQRATSEALDNANMLVTTVEPSLQVACFLNDNGLGKEVIKGLMVHQAIDSVRIFTESGKVLAEQTRRLDQPSDGLTVLRLIYSPFDPAEYVGSIRIELSLKAVEKEVYASTRQIAWSIAGQTLFAALAVMLAIFFLLGPRFEKLMTQITKVNVESGETLVCDAADKQSELGRLVSYINELILRMYLALESERELRLQQEVQQRKYKSLFEYSSSAIFVMDLEGRLQSYNQACKSAALTEEFFIRHQDDIYVPAVLAGDDDERRQFIEEMMSSSQEVRFETHVAGEEDHPGYWYQVHLLPIDDGAYQGVINEITELKLETQAAHDAARSDGLTGLANRLGYLDQLEYYLHETHLGHSSLSVLLVDLDLFKQVNDTYGHEAGDQVLTEVASRMTQSVREHDCVARLGGDEFVILLPRASVNMVERIAKDIISRLNKPFPLAHGGVASIGCSIGIVCVAAGSNISARELMNSADQEMYAVKSSGKNNYRFSGCSQSA